MQFQRLRLGGPDLLFGETVSGNLPFSLPAPADAVHALLESVSLSRDGADVSLQHTQVSLQTLFNPTESKTDGSVLFELQFLGPGGSPALNRVEIGILLVAT